MKMKSNQPKASAEQVVKDIRRATRRHYSTEDKIRIVLSGLRGEDSIAVAFPQFSRQIFLSESEKEKCKCKEPSLRMSSGTQRFVR